LSEPMLPLRTDKLDPSINGTCWSIMQAWLKCRASGASDSTTCGTRLRHSCWPSESLWRLCRPHWVTLTCAPPWILTRISIQSCER